MMKVQKQNMVSERTGRAVPNQFIIRDDVKGITTFQSYDSMIATINYRDNTITIGEDWNYSRTTDKYRNKFFEEQGFSGLAATKGLTLALNKGHYSRGGEDWTIITA